MKTLIVLAVLCGQLVAQTISITPATYTGNGTVSVAVTGTGTAFTGTPFTVAGTPTVSITAQSVSSSTVATLSVSIGNYAGIVTITDTISGAAATLQVFHSSPASTISIGYIGDSITTAITGTTPGPLPAMAVFLSNLTVTQNNQAVGGTSTADWVNGTGGANLSAALSSFAASGVQYVQIALGTNDARTPNLFTPATHLANMNTIVNAVLTAGFKVVINQPIWTVEGSFSGSWGSGINTVYQQYYNADVAALVNGTTVFAGDTAAFNWFESNPTHLTDGVHPTVAGNVEMGGIWANSFLVATHLIAGLPPVPVTGGGVTICADPARSVGTVYHNTNTTALHVSAGIYNGAGSGTPLMDFVADASPTPSAVVSGVTLDTAAFTRGIGAVVLPGYYYEIKFHSGSGTVNVYAWQECH